MTNKEILDMYIECQWQMTLWEEFLTIDREHDIAQARDIMSKLREK